MKRLMQQLAHQFTQQLTRQLVQISLAAVCVLLFAIAPLEAHGQLFGAGRQMGSPLSRGGGRTGGRTGGSAAAAEGIPAGGEVRANSRFLRENRRRTDFVGSDSLEPRGFVGNQQGRAGGAVMSSAVGIRPEIDRSAQINQALPKPKANMPYHPQLQVAFVTPASAGFQSPENIQRELQNPSYFSRTNSFTVSLEGRTAVLRGMVANEKERDLAELLLTFEPGVSEVRNELQVASAAQQPTRQ